MPTYQYTCTACAEPLEAVQSFTDAPLTACPACGGALRKVFSAVGVVFKGSGFYKNDSRKPESSGAPAAAAGEKKADSTPAATTGSGDAAPSKNDRAPAKTDRAPAKTDRAPAKTDKSPATHDSGSTTSKKAAPTPA